MKNDKKYLILILAMSPFIDIVYTIFYQYWGINFPIQQIIRTLIVGYLFIGIKNNRSRCIVSVIFFILIVGQAYILFSKYDYNLMSNIGFIFKIMNLFCGIFFVIEKLQNKYIKVDEILGALNIATIILSLNILISNVFKIGLKTYSYGNREGYKGFIEAHNDISVVLLILLPLAIYQYINKKRAYDLVILAMVSMSLLLIGTKSGKALLLLELTVIGGILLFIRFDIKKYIIRFKSIIIFTFILVTLGFYSNFGKINTQLSELANSKGYRSVYSYIVSYRNIQPILIDNAIEDEYKIHPKYKFGMGYYYANKVLHDQKEEFNSIENDVDGLIYYTGMFTAAFIIWILMCICWKIIKYSNLKDILSSFIVLILAITAIHSFLGGHVIYSGISTTYFGAVIGLGYFYSTNSYKERDI